MITYKYHVYNFIKQCPYCGLVWYKVLGCDTLTYCGEFPERDDERFEPKTMKFKIEFHGSEVEVINQSNLLEIIKRSEFDKKPPKTKGCGKRIAWNNLYPLSKDLLKEL